jgi:hypothetical protein
LDAVALADSHFSEQGVPDLQHPIIQVQADLAVVKRLASDPQLAVQGAQNSCWLQRVAPTVI